MENPIKMDDLGGTIIFWKHPYINFYNISLKTFPTPELDCQTRKVLPRLQSDVFIGKSKWDGLLLPCKNRLFLVKYLLDMKGLQKKYIYIYIYPYFAIEKHEKTTHSKQTRNLGNGNPLLVEHMLHSNTPGSPHSHGISPRMVPCWSQEIVHQVWSPPRLTVTTRMTVHFQDRES